MGELAVIPLADDRVFGGNRRQILRYGKNTGNIAVAWTDK
jgi:hypothetical protein